MPEKGFDSFSNTGEGGESDGRAENRERGATAFEIATSMEERDKLFTEIEELERKIAEEKAFQREIEEKLKVIRASKETSENGEGSNSESEGEFTDAMAELDVIGRGESGDSTTAEEIIEEVEGSEGVSDDVEVETTETKAKKTSERAKRDRRIGAFFTGVAVLGLVGGIVALKMSKEDKSEEVPEPSPAGSAEIMPNPVTEGDFGVEKIEVEKGILDGYGEKGMWMSEGKTSAVAFAEAGQVAEVCNNDEVEMIKYTAHNQVESFADYMANLPEALQPDGFKGLNLLQTEARLESLSPEEYAAVEAAFGSIMDNALTRRVTLNGQYDNAFMRMKDPNGTVTHGNMELVRCTTTENNVEVTEFYWMDAEGHEVGKMTVKMAPIYDENGNVVSFELCEQVVNEPGDDIYDGVPEIPVDPDDPSEPTPTPVVTPTPAPETPDTPETPTPETPDTPETPAPETPTPETPTPETPTPETPTPETPTPETPAPKDPENMARIDNQIQQDIAEDIGTEQVVVHQETAAPQDVTTPPPAEAYEGTAPTIVENEAAPAAEAVQEQVSEANNYSENRGGANANEYAPVQENQAAQQAVNAAETPIEQAPSASDVSTQEVDDYLAGLGL